MMTFLFLLSLLIITLFYFMLLYITLFHAKSIFHMLCNIKWHSIIFIHVIPYDIILYYVIFYFDIIELYILLYFLILFLYFMEYLFRIRFYANTLTFFNFRVGHTFVVFAGCSSITIRFVLKVLRIIFNSIFHFSSLTLKPIQREIQSLSVYWYPAIFLKCFVTIRIDFGLVSLKLLLGFLFLV